MKRITVEEKIRVKFDCTIKEFVEQQLEEGTPLPDMAEMVPCSAGTLRKLALDNGISFAEPKKEIKFVVDSSSFQSNHLNMTNALSRSWAVA